ncbi:lipase 1-like [Teleopsis dalmanni]|uniref:lipase 1-like n=1 Tax=Teleopsis dalmanni TaxID=139649 RepID=UPI0018CEC3D2|nr:lipase 1-like [Teleopsis dalmanni]
MATLLALPSTGSKIELPANLLQTSNLTMAALMQNFDMEELWTTVQTVMIQQRELDEWLTVLLIIVPLLDHCFNFCETLIARQGYTMETHRVVTEDNYILTMHRLPRAGHQPVLLVHGLYGSATDFIIMGRNISLAYLLWDGYYDVWLANCRGSNNSQQHQKLTVDELLYWNFSFQDIGMQDLPAIIDYIRSNTSFQYMHYVGHSQGASAFLVLASMKPEYIEKLAVVQLLSPMAYFKNIQVEQMYLQTIADFLKENSSREIRNFLPLGILRQLNCLRNEFLELTCLQMIFELIGKDLEQLDLTKLNIFFNQYPAGGSVKQLRHFYQIYKSASFQAYDYGLEGNYDKYGTALPLRYNLSKITAPIYIYYGLNDLLVSKEDVLLLAEQLPNLQQLYLVAHKNFNHLDFIWAKDLKKLVNDQILKVLKDFNNKV